MESLEKAPRWFLLIVSGAAISVAVLIGGWTIRQAFADIDTIKSVAYSAKTQSNSNNDSIQELKLAMSEMKTAQETFRREYREDQKDIISRLGDLMRAVKS